MNRMFPPGPAPGFTLVELLIVVAVLAVVLLLAVPSMSSLVHGTRLWVEAGRLQLAVNLARAEAVKRNAPVSLCPSRFARGGALACDGDFSDGWIVFANPGRSNRPAKSGDTLIRAFGPAPGGYRVTGQDAKPLSTVLTYYSDGATRRNLTLMVCPPPAVTRDSWSVVINRVGRPRLARGWRGC